MNARLRLMRNGREALARAVPFPVYAALRSAWRRARLLVPAGWLSTSYPGIPGAVHDEDYMLVADTPDAAARYAQVGREAVERVGAALDAVGRSWDDAATFLDFGAGYGRVLRWVREWHPAVAVTAADINRQAVAFCAGELGATPLVVPPRVADLRLPGPYDAVWVGSVVTHLSPDDGEALLATLASSLAPGGILVFTTHGTLIPERIPEYGEHVGHARAALERRLDEGGVFHFPAGRNAYPLTFHAPEAVRGLLGRVRPAVRFVAHVSRGWDDHQDVWSCQRTG